MNKYIRNIVAILMIVVLFTQLFHFLLPRGGDIHLIICMEGAFGWEDDKLEYDYYGEFNP